MNVFEKWKKEEPGENFEASLTKIVEKEKSSLDSFRGRAAKLAVAFMLISSLAVSEMAGIAKATEEDPGLQKKNVPEYVLPNTRGDVDRLYNQEKHIANPSFNQKLALDYHGWIKEEAQLQTIEPYKEFAIKNPLAGGPYEFDIIKVKFLSANVENHLKDQNINFDAEKGTLVLQNENNRVINLNDSKSANVQRGTPVREVFIWTEKANAVEHRDDLGMKDDITKISPDKEIVRVRLLAPGFGYKEIYISGGTSIEEITKLASTGF